MKLITGILIGSDNRLLAHLLRDHLAAVHRTSVIRIAVDEHSALAHLKTEPVDVAVVDSSMEDARELVRQVMAEHPALHTIVFGLRRDEQEVGDFAEAGAVGFALRDADLVELGKAIRSVILGECRCSPWVTAALLRHAVRAGQRCAPSDSCLLTVREDEIARLLCAGKSNKEIARLLSIEIATVKNHVHNILQKLNVPSRAKAVAELQTVGIL